MQSVFLYVFHLAQPALRSVELRLQHTKLAGSRHWAALIPTIKDFAGARVNYAMNPAIMGISLKSIAHDKIDFGANKAGADVRPAIK